MEPNLFCVFDTETTGEPKWREPSEQEDQPHIVELAALLVDDDTGEIVEQMCAYVRTDGWVIPEEVIAIHGITNEQANEEGFPEAEVINNFIALWRRAKYRVEHNTTFDDRIIRIALKRYLGDAVADEFKAGKKICTMWESRPVCAIPNNGNRKGIKLPKLEEAHQILLGRPLEGAHSAMGDALGTLALYQHLRKNGKIRPFPADAVDAVPVVADTSAPMPLGL